MELHDDTQLHPTNWADMLRYARHTRGADWSPPLVTLPVSEMDALTYELTPYEFGLYHALIYAYARSPLIGTDHRGPRRLTMARWKALQTFDRGRSGNVPRGTKRLISAGLVQTVTADERPVLEREGEHVRELELEHVLEHEHEPSTSGRTSPNGIGMPNEASDFKALLRNALSVEDCADEGVDAV